MSSETRERAYYYAGEYKRSLDDKRRLIVPAKWRFSGDDKDNAYLALPNPNGSITVYPPNMLEKLDEKISQAGLTNPSRQRVLLKIFRNGERFGCDKQGRISLTDKLMSMAGIAKDAILVGAYQTFQIWDPERFDKFINEDDGEDPNEVWANLVF